jgi:hypothetical protein
LAREIKGDPTEFRSPYLRLTPLHRDAILKQQSYHLDIYVKLPAVITQTMCFVDGVDRLMHLVATQFHDIMTFILIGRSNRIIKFFSLLFKLQVKLSIHVIR